MNELNELKNTWKSIVTPETPKIRPSGGDRTDRACSIARSYTSIKRKYILSIAFSVLVMMLAPVLHRELEAPLWICWIYFAYGAFMFALNATIYFYLNARALPLMPTSQAIVLAIRILNISKIRIAAGCMTGVLVIGTLFYFFIQTGSIEALWGAIIGLLLGGAIGAYKTIGLFKELKKVVRRLTEIENDLNNKG